MFNNQFRETILQYNKVMVLKESGQILTEKQEKAIADFERAKHEMLPNAKFIAEQTDAMKGDYATVAAWVRKKTFEIQTKYFLISLWDMLAFMLLGIGLYKTGFFTGEWTKIQYQKTLIVGYGLGIPLVIFYRMYYIIVMPDNISRIAFLENNAVDWVGSLYDIQRIIIMMAHVALIILIYKAGYLKRLMNSLKAVGQMAFTNYIMQTVICTLFFSGYGLNYFAELEYSQIYFLLIAIWIFQLIFSPVWLHYFKFGPLEWIWRCLTYRKIFPFRRPKQKWINELETIPSHV
jgi:uncharacterized protein